MKKTVFIFIFTSLLFSFGFFAASAAVTVKATKVTTVAADPSDFQVDLKNTLEPQRGSGAPTFTRADGADRRATVTDWEGRVIAVKAGEARFEGARRVENLVLNSEYIMGAGWTSTAGALRLPNNDLRLANNGAGLNLSNITVNVGDVVVTRMELYNATTTTTTISGTAALYNGNGSTLASQNFSLAPGVRKVLEMKGTITIAGSNSGINIANWSSYTSWLINASKFQFEIVTGQSNQNPSEYVPTGIIKSAPYNGANVDGVQYFPYLNGNTVDGYSLVTDKKGAALSEDTLHGYLSEPSATNIALQNQNFANGSWVASNMTVAMEAVVAPNGSSTVQSITAGAGNATILQTTTGSATTTSFYLKRKTGTGNIDMTMDNGTTWTTVAVTSSWQRFFVTKANQTNPVIGIRIVTSGDAVYIWGAQAEQSSSMTSFIPTTNASVTRAADALSYTEANFNKTQGTAYAEVMPNGFAGSVTWPSHYAILGTGNNGRILFFKSQTNTTDVNFSDGTNYSSVTGSSFVNGNIRKVASRWNSGGRTFTDNTAGNAGTFNGKLVTGSLGIGNFGTAPYINNLSGTIKNVKIWKRAMSDAKIQTFTSSVTSTARPVFKSTTVNINNNTQYAGGLVGLWSFNGPDMASTTIAYDRSGNNNFGTTTAMRVPGKIGQGLYLNGSNMYVGVGSTTLIALGVKSVSFWIMPNSTTESILDLNNGTDKITLSAGTLSVTGFGGAATTYVDGVAGSTVGTDAWHHVVVTTASTLTPSYIKIGNVAGTYYHGYLDEVRLYNTTLSATNVWRLYKLGS